jgi:hypothetical protein
LGKHQANDDDGRHDGAATQAHPDAPRSGVVALQERNADEHILKNG